MKEKPPPGILHSGNLFAELRWFGQPSFLSRPEPKPSNCKSRTRSLARHIATWWLQPQFRARALQKISRAARSSGLGRRASKPLRSWAECLLWTGHSPSRSGSPCFVSSPPARTTSFPVFSVAVVQGCVADFAACCCSVACAFPIKPLFACAVATRSTGPGGCLHKSPIPIMTTQ